MSFEIRKNHRAFQEMVPLIPFAASLLTALALNNLYGEPGLATIDYCVAAFCALIARLIIR